MNFAADDFQAINARRRAIRREEKKSDDDPNTASGIDLDAIAAGYHIYRASDGESDYTLRHKVLDHLRKMSIPK
jgi:hypothetical protein